MRELGFLLKLTVTMAFLGSEEVRARSGFAALRRPFRAPESAANKKTAKKPARTKAVAGGSR